MGNKSHKLLLYHFVVVLFFVVPVQVKAMYFQDGFEKANMSATDSDGFKWLANNRTSVVTQNSTYGPTAVYNNRNINNSAPAVLNNSVPRNWTAKDGKYSLRVHYPAGANWAEQRFLFGKAYPDLWLSYWIRVPQNYYRGSVSNVGGAVNNKWGIFLMGTMKGNKDYRNKTVSLVEMRDWPNNNGGCNLDMSFRNGTNGRYHTSKIYTDFITPADAGRWMQIVYHLKASRSSTSTDGILQMYRRWSNETSFTLINDLENINVGIGKGSIASGYFGWGGGYLMGYANAPYAHDTNWLIDDFTISTTSLLKKVKK